jgi:hypothetical protein
MKSREFCRWGALVAFILSGCQREGPLEAPSAIPDQTNGRITVINDEAKLAARLTITDEPIGVEALQLGKVEGLQAFSLRQIAEITPPTVNGEVVQATSVTLEGQFAYITYNMAGSEYLGAIDIVQVKSGSNAALRSEATFNDADVSSVCYDGKNVYMATACGDPLLDYASVVDGILSSGGKLDLSATLSRNLTSYVATSVTVGSRYVYTTTGNTGGLTALTRDTLGVASFVALDDARWVDCRNGLVVVAQGTPGRLAVFDEASGAPRGTFAFDGASIPESKSTVRIVGDKALIAAGDGGVKLMSLVDGTIVGSLPRCIVAGLDPSRSVTNAADAAGQYLYISNGEAGVYVAQASTALENVTGSTPITLTMLGHLRFDNLQSVNHVAYDGSTLVVAAGLGGVKIVTVSF